MFVVASSRKGFCPAEVLFEFDGVRRDVAPSRESGQETAGNAGAGVKSAGSHGELVGTLCARDFKGVGNQYVSEGKLVVSESVGFRKLTFESYTQDETASTMMARDHKSYTDLVAFGVPGNWIGRKPENGGNSTQFMHEVSPAQTATDKHGVICIGGQHPNAAIGEEVTPTLTEAMGTGGGHIPIINNVIAGTQNDAFRDATDNLAPTLRSGSGGGVVNQAVATQTAVRRLTPVECERLMGFPGGYTAIHWRNKPAEECPDGHRYKALGNSMAVPVMRWIGERINAFLP